MVAEIYEYRLFHLKPAPYVVQQPRYARPPPPQTTKNLFSSLKSVEAAVCYFARHSRHQGK